MLHCKMRLLSQNGDDYLTFWNQLDGKSGYEIANDKNQPMDMCDQSYKQEITFPTPKDAFKIKIAWQFDHRFRKKNDEKYRLLFNFC